MHVPKSLKDQVVTIQLGRPLYVMDYVAHVRLSASGSAGDLLACEPVTMVDKNDGDQKPLVMDILLGVQVSDVSDDSITVQVVTPMGHLVRKTIPSALILSIDQMFAFEPLNPPLFRKKEPNRIITP